MTIDSILPSMRIGGAGAPGLLNGVGRTNASLARVQMQLVLGQAMLRASDDPQRSAALARLTASLEQSLTRSDLLLRGANLLEASDAPLARSLDLLAEARALVSKDTTASLPESERQAIATELDQLIARLTTEGNARFGSVHLFGGTRAGGAPWNHRGDGVLYMGRGRGLDVGLGEPVTISGHEAFGGVSRRVDLSGTVDLSAGLETPLAAWGAGPLGSIRISVGSMVQVVDLSGAVTLRDLKNIVEGLDMGVRVEFDAATGKAWIRNALSGPGLSISDLTGDDTATRLGIDTLATYTLLSDFNDGRGVRFAVPGIDPVTGQPANNTGADLLISLKDGRFFVVDFTNETTVGQVLATINAAAAAAGISQAEFFAGLRANGNGLLLTDNTAGPGGFTVAGFNNSWAAEDLGILGGTTGAVIAGEDRAQVAVDGAFTWLLRLRDAVIAGDPLGISIALDGVDRAVDRVALARSGAGAKASRLAMERVALEEIVVQQKSLRSLLGDIDLAEASTRLSQLSVQLQAGLAALARAGSLSLLRYLG
ncbi:MAG: hypothetical protein KF724_04410 [Phycisphaeraceae bacterium]|nr:hypothetical protein [Phycisphaeraceae bacterium]